LHKPLWDKFAPADLCLGSPLSEPPTQYCATPAKGSKILLQEASQSRHLPLPHYELINATGHAHEQIFSISCNMPALSILTTGTANSRSAAEQAAAQSAYEVLNK
jgi:ribonuclease-3